MDDAAAVDDEQVLSHTPSRGAEWDRAILLIGPERTFDEPLNGRPDHRQASATEMVSEDIEARLRAFLCIAHNLREDRFGS